MKANKLMRTLAASAMSLALLAGVTALPAMAAQTGGVAQDQNTFAAKSTLKVPDKIATPAVTLTYTVAPDDTVVEGTTKYQDMLVYKGVAGAVTFTGAEADGTYNVVYTAGAAQEDNDKGYYEVTKNMTFNVDASQFGHAGIYKYTVTVKQEDTKVANVTPDAGKVLYIYVADNNGTKSVRGIVMQTLTGTDAQTKTDAFVTTYLFDEDGNPDPKLYGDVTVTKKVDGTFGDKTQKFEFPVTVPANCYFEYGTVGEDGQFTATSHGVTTGSNDVFKLAHGESVRIYGVVNTSYTVSEKDYQSEGYETTHVGNESGTITADSHAAITYTNTRDAGSVTPTGIVMNIAPYALMVVVALAGVVVFMRKRVEE